MNSTTNTPKHVRVDREGGWFEIEWSDGNAGRITLDYLRQQCPCALCDGLRERGQSDGLNMITEDDMPSTELVDITPVGTYALQISWADGHDTGIYTYLFLRKLLQASTAP